MYGLRLCQYNPGYLEYLPPVSILPITKALVVYIPGLHPSFTLPSVLHATEGTAGLKHQHAPCTCITQTAARLCYTSSGLCEPCPPVVKLRARVGQPAVKSTIRSQLSVFCRNSPSPLSVALQC